MPEEISSFDVGILTFKRFHNLGALCMTQGSYAEARDWWKAALAAAPSFTPSALELFDAAIAAMDLRTAQEALDALRKAEGPSDSWANRLCKLAETTGQNAEQALRSFLHFNPYATGPLMALAKMLMGRGDPNGAAPLLEELDRLGSAEAAFFRGIFALSACDLRAALGHMNRAHELNPVHEDTEKHLKELKRVLALELPPPLEASGRDVLAGPHIGKLGPGSCPFSIVVVAYNSASTISECVERVLATTGHDDELIIVDNASTDGTAHMLRAMAGSDARIRLIRNEANLGYSRAANIGLLASRGEFLVTLNPDAYVEPCWLESMSSCLGGEIAAVGPMSDNISGDQFVGHILGGRHPALEELPPLLKSKFLGRREETKFLVGICVMVRRETLDANGLLDEGTELGADDLELSWRLRVLGGRLTIAQDVFVRHDQGVSFSTLPHLERAQRQARSDAALVRKLEAYYGKGNIPTSLELWDNPIFEEALARIGLLE